MKFLVTGGAGLIGSTLCERLLDRGETVLCVDNLSLGTQRHLEGCMKRKGFSFEQMSVSRPGWHNALQGQSFDVLAHLAANSDISLGRERPETDKELTFDATFAALLAAKDLGIPNFLFSSSSAVYGANPAMPTLEAASNMHPVSLYGAAKLSSEAFISAWVENYGLNAWVCRFGNVVGRRLTHGAIYDFVARLRKDPERLVVLGDGNQTKTYIDVEDCVDGILRAFEKSPPGRTHASKFQVFNLSTEGATSVREIAEETAKVVTGGKCRISYGTSSVGWVGDVPKTNLDVRKMISLGWSPRKGSTEAVAAAIRAYVEWSR